MALTLGANTTDRIDAGSAAGIDDLAALSFIVWVYPTTITVGRVVISKYRGSVNAGWYLELTTGGLLDMLRERATTDLHYTASSLALALNTWGCVAGTIDSSAGHIYVGSLTAALAEPSYSTADAGSGAIVTDVARSLFIGGRDATTPNGAWQGRMGPVALFNRVLTLAELREQQFLPHRVSGCVGLWRPGDAGVTAVPDYSGAGNTGTATGAIAAANPPLRLPFLVTDQAVPYAFTPTAPGAPGAPTAYAGDGYVSATWTAATANGAAVDDYELTATIGGVPQTPVSLGAVTATTITCPNGSACTFTVRAHNSVGWGSASSASNEVTPPGFVVSPSNPNIRFSGYTRRTPTTFRTAL